MIKIKRVIKEAEAIPTSVPTLAAPATSGEKTVDDAAVTSKLINFSKLGNTNQTLVALSQDFKNLTGDQRYISLSQFLTSLGINKQDLAATVNKMK
jgi:hypothetical protein